MFFFTIIIQYFFVLCAKAQTPIETSGNYEQQIENITENNGDIENEDDAYLQQLQYYIKHPINLNTADENDLTNLKLLTPLEIQNFILYRNLFGKLIDIYELQAIPSWNILLIKKILLYVNVNNDDDIFYSIKSRLKKGENNILFRVSETIEKSKGYLINSPTTNNFYLGSPQKIYVRYKYQFKNLLQYGIVGEKDAGEQFFKGKQKTGFDFYSAHFFVNNLGKIKALALGDFTVNFGQGLIQWQSLAFKKSSSVLNIKRESPILMPYNSAGEINFHRGVGITLKKNNVQFTGFISYKKIDANFVTDTTQINDDFVSSFQTSGLHRTKSEIDDKGIEHQLAIGSNISYQYKLFRIGLNTIQYKFNLPLIKSNDPYNLYALSGNRFGNSSVDYSFTFKNFHFFGEVATTNKLDKAFLSGLLVSVTSSIDMSFLYRNISPKFQSLYSTAFTENSSATNERGLFSGITIRPNDLFRIDAYADFYKFPWLKYSVNAPTNGSDYLIQCTYKPNKFVELSSSFRSSDKALNFNPNNLILSPVIKQPLQNWRTQFNWTLNKEIAFKARFETVWFSPKTNFSEQGFLSFFEIFYNPSFKPWTTNLRLQYFETDSYNSRLYAYENDVLFSYSVPVMYDKGFRYYLNYSYQLSKKIIFWARFAQTIYRKSTISSGLDEIIGNKKSEIKLQIVYKL